jgi:anaerobic magnesium-protoporphyrin IX monomethyl ester cyclase
MAMTWPWSKPKRTSNVLWLDLGDLGDLVNPSGPHEQWQDHGLGLLRTILHQNGMQTDLASTRAVTSWEQLARQMQGYDMLLMNVRSYTFPAAYQGGPTLQRTQSQRPGAGGRHARHCCAR